MRCPTRLGDVRRSECPDASMSVSSRIVAGLAGLAKGTAGLLGNSFALVADGLESLMEYVQRFGGLLRTRDAFRPRQSVVPRPTGFVKG